MKKLSWFKTHWKTSVGITMILASVVVLLMSVGIFKKPATLENATLRDFTIVAAPGHMEQAREVYTEIAKETGIIFCCLIYC